MADALDGGGDLVSADDVGQDLDGVVGLGLVGVVGGESDFERGTGLGGRGEVADEVLAAADDGAGDEGEISVGVPVPSL